MLRENNSSEAKNTGRIFFDEDPAKDGINWYVYCGNNPLSRIDRTGLSWDNGEYIDDGLGDYWDIGACLASQGYSEYEFGDPSHWDGTYDPWGKDLKIFPVEYNGQILGYGEDAYNRLNGLLWAPSVSFSTAFNVNIALLQGKAGGSLTMNGSGNQTISPLLSLATGVATPGVGVVLAANLNLAANLGTRNDSFSASLFGIGVSGSFSENGLISLGLSYTFEALSIPSVNFDVGIQYDLFTR